MLISGCSARLVQGRAQPAPAQRALLPGAASQRRPGQHLQVPGGLPREALQPDPGGAGLGRRPVESPPQQSVQSQADHTRVSRAPGQSTAPNTYLTHKWIGPDVPKVSRSEM